MHGQLIIQRKMMRSSKSPFFTTPVKPTKGAMANGPLASLKKFCESLPCSGGRPSGLNLIVWRRRIYSPNEKQRRLKVENDVVRQRIAHEDSQMRRRHVRTRSLTEPSAHGQGSYQEEYGRIARQEVSTSLLSREEEEVFGSMGEDSVREEFKRNHKDVWGFIVGKKKSGELSEFTPGRKCANNAEIEERRQQKQQFKQRLNDYLRKWKPSQRSLLSNSRTASGSTNGNSSGLCSKFTTVAVKSEAWRGGGGRADCNISE